MTEHLNIRTGDIKDNSGLIATGKYINQIQINLENASGKELNELIDVLNTKRQEEFNKKILGSYSPSALPQYPPKLREFVTENRAYEINQALIYLQHHRILFISGMGGVGKTTLARALVETTPANVPPFWFDFGKRSDATLGDVLEKLAGYLKTPGIARFREEGREAEQDDINRLTDELGKRDSLLFIFDNLETALDDLIFHDPGIDSLFSSLRDSTHKAKIIITSRIMPVLADGESLIDILEDEKQEIKGLKTNFAIDYLVKNGLDAIERSQLEELASGVEGHPLALKLLIGVTKKFGIEDTLDDLSLFQRQKESTIKKARNLFDKLVGDEKELLERISVFRRPESKTIIEKMFTADTSKDAIGYLIDKSLLETDNKGNYWLHPLVREFAYDDLENKVEVHKIAYQYYFSLPIPELQSEKEDVQPLIEAHYHACKAREYDNAAYILFEHGLHSILFSLGKYRTLVDLYTAVLPEDHFGNTLLLSSKQVHMKVLEQLGIAYRAMGDLRKSIEYYEMAIKMNQEINDRETGNELNRCIADAYSVLGEHEKALEYIEKAMREVV